MIDWNAMLKVATGVLFAFGAGWAVAVLSDVPELKALASGVMAAASYYGGQRQEKVDFTKKG